MCAAIARISLTFIGEKNPLRVPPVWAMCVSVILCAVIKTGAKKRFSMVPTENAVSNWSQGKWLKKLMFNISAGANS